MAKMTYRPDPSQKHLEIINDFSGGMNTVDADSTMENNKLRRIINMELTTKGALVKREGFSRVSTVPIGNNVGIGTQLMATYYKSPTEREDFYIINGVLYNSLGEVQKYKNLEGTFVDANIFQKERMMSYVVYNKIMIVATGNFMLEYGEFPDDDEDTSRSYHFRHQEPYTPTAVEYSKIGANILSDDPAGFIKDGVSSILVNEGVVSKNVSATINIAEEFTTYISKPAEMAYYIKWEVKLTSAEDWTDINNGYQKVTGDTNKKISHTFEVEGSYSIRSIVTPSTNISGTTVADITKTYAYVISDYQVTTSEDIEDETEYKPMLCNHIMVYYDQVLLWGDPEVPNALYISDIFKPSYVPYNHIIKFEILQDDEVTSLVEYYGVLVVFSKDTIYSLRGTNPYDFAVVPVNRTVGCIAPMSAVSVKNVIVFLSKDGLYMLKTLSTINVENFNIEKIDLDIFNEIPKPYDEYATAVQYGLAYIITLPTYKKRFKWYYEQKVWAMDEGDIFDFNITKNDDGKFYGARPNGTVVISDGTVYTDDGELFSCILETKRFDVGYPQHPKKFKNIKVAYMNDPNNPTELYMTIQVDSSIVVNPEKYTVYERDDEQIVYDYERVKNVQLYSGTKFGSWVVGTSMLGIVPTTIQKSRLTGKGYTITLILEHKDNTDFGVLGYAYIYKVKKP